MSSSNAAKDDRIVAFKMPDDMNHADREPALVSETSELPPPPGMVSPVLSDLIVAYCTQHKVKADDIVATLSSVMMRLLAGMKSRDRESLAFYQAMIQVSFENPKAFNIPERKVYYLHPRDKK